MIVINNSQERNCLTTTKLTMTFTDGSSAALLGDSSPFTLKYELFDEDCADALVLFIKRCWSGELD
jgi:hypothetical protein